MRIPKFYQNQSWEIGDKIILNNRVSHYFCVVLRSKNNENCLLFNGDGFEYLAILITPHKKNATVMIQQRIKNNTESSLHIHLAQMVSMSQKMDYTIQKATELGVTQITPIINEYTHKKWDAVTINKKMQHWQNITIASSEQSNRVTIPIINPPIHFKKFIQHASGVNKYILDGAAKHGLPKQKTNNNDIIVLIGAESGINKIDLQLAIHNQFVAIKIGPRTLRTETVAPVILALLQNLWGDI